ncbi:glycoside hydrolase family 28 protein / polygalacturonase (pectinase) family protein [Corchorus olitorius]|uniref:Glycoside hydrolase family 28 protein / polygalacturonase (Pectinase) family protein n=1 Tax=Corchorus olitorius TaxID=93759 RepID=A0A1R3GHB4_9ROSI|nr:glycoside hydrolase family 28 protein / polygalacturonase (pectinase) family protein [Corchorus olitorius]
MGRARATMGHRGPPWATCIFRKTKVPNAKKPQAKCFPCLKLTKCSLQTPWHALPNASEGLGSFFVRENEDGSFTGHRYPQFPVMTKGR